MRFSRTTFLIGGDRFRSRLHTGRGILLLRPVWHLACCLEIPTYDWGRNRLFPELRKEVGPVKGTLGSNWAQGWRGVLVAVFLCLVATAVGVAQFDLRRHPSFAAPEADLREAIGLQMSRGSVHLDLIAARSAVVRDLEIALGSFRLRAPRAVIQPAWGTWREGKFVPAIYAERFEVWLDAEDSAEAFLRLEMAHARFSQGRKRFGYARSIDLNPLVPEVKVAAAP